MEKNDKNACLLKKSV